jgi:hypothetical protein
MVRHERESKAGPNFGSYVDDELRSILRNISYAALARGRLTIKRDPRPLMASPAYFALEPWLSVHPKRLLPWRLNYEHRNRSICAQGMRFAMALTSSLVATDDREDADRSATDAPRH